MRRFGFLILLFISASASAQVSYVCPPNSYKRVACNLKPQTATTYPSRQIVVCQLSPGAAIMIYKDSKASTDNLNATFFAQANGTEIVQAGPTYFGGPIEIKTPKVGDGTKANLVPAQAKFGSYPYTGLCEFDKSPQSLGQQITNYPIQH